MIKREIPFIVSSNPLVGAQNVRSNGSRFDITLSEAIVIPHDAENITIDVEEATVWWSVPNITTGTNDKMYFDHSGTPYTVTIPQGLYDLSALNQTIQRELSNLGAPTAPPLISLSADDATQKVELIHHYTGVTTTFNADSPYAILGFNLSQVLGPNVTAPLTYLAPNVAVFNQINFFLIHGDIVSKGLRFNGSYSQILSQVLIDVAPGSQIIHKPYNPPKIPEQSLRGSIRSNLSFWITDDSNNPINTNNETWSIRLIIRYNEPETKRVSKGEEMIISSLERLNKVFSN